MDGEFSFFAHGIINCFPDRTTNLLQLYKVITGKGKTGSQLISQTAAIRQLPGEANKKERNRLKAGLPYVSFGGVFDYRSGDVEKTVAELRQKISSPKSSRHQKENATATLERIEKEKPQGLLKASGYFCIDIDGHDNPGLMDADNVEEWKNTFAADGDLGTRLIFRSPSGDGLKVVVKAQPDIRNAADYTEAFFSLQNYLKSNYNIAIDNNRKDITGACYICHDENAILTDGLEDFDTNKWKPQPVVKKVEKKPQGHNYATAVLTDDEYGRAASAVEDIVSSGIDIAPERSQWLSLCSALSNLGEPGRQLFHDCCRACPKYDAEDNDRVFSEFMAKGKSGSGKSASIETLFYLAKNAGVQLRYSPGLQRELMQRDFCTHKGGEAASGEKLKRKETSSAGKGWRIDSAAVEASERLVEQTGLFKFLCKHFDEDSVRSIMKEYHVGGDKNGWTVFWQVDRNGEARTARILDYQEDGTLRKDKTGKPAISWAHYRLMKEGKLPESWEKKECLFGEHLLTFDDLPRHACLVKDERTAIIAACAIPQYIWIACGGEYNLKPSRWQELRKYCKEEGKLTVFADVGDIPRWQRKMEIFALLCPTDFSDIMEDEGMRKGSTLADFILEH